MKERKGYIGRSMSINAKRARDKGLLPASYWSSEMLKENGFMYPVSFFRWLCTNIFIMPKECHHTGCSFRYTKYFDVSSIEYLVARYDLDLLYQIFTNKITKEEAMKNKGISYVKIKTTDKILGLKGMNMVTLNCIKYKKTIWYSKSKFINENSNEYKVVEEFDEMPTTNFENPNIKGLSEFLLRYKPRHTFILANKSKLG